MATPLHTPKESFWREQLQCWLRSGLGVRAFCEKHNLSEPNFYVWRRTLVERGLIAFPVPTTPAFVPLRLDTTPPTPTTTPIEVVLAQGRVLRVASGFDANTLRRLVETLEEVRPC